MSETTRILTLPVDTRSPEEALEDLVAEYTGRLQAASGAWSLFPAQALALAVLEECGGLFASIMVGGGKTLIASLAPRVLGIRPWKTLLLTRAKLIPPFHREQARYGAHFQIEREMHVYSYAALSQPGRGPTLLHDLQPDLIIADEAHALKNEKSSRRRRIERYFADHPETKFVAMSGTMTKTSIMDYHLQAEIALREGTPLPRSESALRMWSACLDATERGAPPLPFEWQALQPLVDWHTEREGTPSTRVMDVPVDERRELCRRAYFARLSSTPGVVHTRTDRVGASLEIELICDLQVPSEVRDAMQTADLTYTLPDGEELDSPLAKARSLSQLVQGMYYRWDWPGEPDMEWLFARRAYAKQIRLALESCQKDEALMRVDSPKLVEDAFVDGRLDGLPDAAEMLQAWSEWQMHAHKPAPPTVPVWISEYLVADAARRARASKGTPPAIIWYTHRHVARALSRHGVDVYWPEEDRNPELADSEKGPIALSVHAHTDGLNMQYGWHRNIVLCAPSDGGTWEQLIGRTHRNGQEADTVHVEIYAHAPVLVGSLKEALRRARYIEQNNGQQQKLLIADWINGDGLGPEGT